MFHVRLVAVVVVGEGEEEIGGFAAAGGTEAGFEAAGEDAEGWVDAG